MQSRGPDFVADSAIREGSGSGNETMTGEKTRLVGIECEVSCREDVLGWGHDRKWDLVRSTRERERERERERLAGVGCRLNYRGR